MLKITITRFGGQVQHTKYDGGQVRGFKDQGYFTNHNVRSIMDNSNFAIAQLQLRVLSLVQTMIGFGSRYNLVKMEGFITSRKATVAEWIVNENQF